MRRCNFILLLALLAGCATRGPSAPTPPGPDSPPDVMREFRAAWVATVANIDWPSRPGLAPSEQQRELLAILDRSREIGLNAVILQVRPSADALYDSPLEPWSPFLTGSMGEAPEPYYDPLEFAVTEAHRRGLELHAWFNPYRAGHPSTASGYSEDHISRTRPELVREYGSYLWMDPGEEAVRDHSVRVILDVVRRYDIDGVHLDDYFYPYQEREADGTLVEFPDDAPYGRYQAAGGSLERDDWRRRNVDLLIERLYREIKGEKPWVKFGISPFGIWRPGVPSQIAGFDAYSGIYADAWRWLTAGWVDYFTPQLYWPTAQAAQSYPVLLGWWAEQNVRGRHIWPGMFTGRVTDRRASGWPASEVLNQIYIARGHPGAGGHVHFSMKSLMPPVDGTVSLRRDSLTRRLRREAYGQPALVPPSPWLRCAAPGRPDLALNTPGPGGRATVTLTPRGKEQPWLWVIRSRADGRWSTEIVPGHERAYTLPDAGLAPLTLVVSAVGRTGNEGPIARIALPAHARATAEGEPDTESRPRAGRTGRGTDAWTESTLASLSLRQKVAQLIMPWVGGDYTAIDSPGFDRLRRWVEEDQVGGLVLSVGMPLSYAAKLNELQKRAAVPLLIASDMENGPGMRMGGIYSLPHLLAQGGGTVFPPVMALGAAGSDSLAFALGRVLGSEARAVGVHMAFGPVLDVNSNPANPIINTRSFGEDPELVSRLATAYIRGARAEGLMTTGKHFPGHGDTDVDSHIDLPIITADRARMDTVELPPFRAAIEAGMDAIMTAHVAVTGVEGEDAPPATLSPYFMTEVLREEMDFDGLLFTDAMTMGGVARRYGATEPLVLALEAGADVLLMPRSVTQAVETVVAAVADGRITEQRIDASVRRVLRAKSRAGLPASRYVSLDAVDETVGTRAHAELAREVAERSLVLARDDRDLVPLDPSARVLSLTYAAEGDPVAGRTFNSALARGVDALHRARVDERTTTEEFAELRERADSMDVVVVSAYVSPREYRGAVDAESTFSGFVESLAAEGRPVVVVSFGSPYLLSDFPSVSSYLLAWGGAEGSQGVAARALLGQIPITGTLPISLPPYHDRGEGLERTGNSMAEAASQ